MAVTRFDITKAARQVGIRKGDIVMMHSSFKSLGEVDGGAETVIGGMLDAVGEEGTLVLPTFSQKDFGNSYKTWHMDKPSDTGYLTEYFRKREGSLRSDQATHSVAAFGKMAKEITATHGHTHKRFGNFGDTPFSADSPYEKMYNMNGMGGNMFPVGETLVLNANHPLVQFLGEHKDEEHVTMICEQLYDLAMLSHRPLEPEAMTKFVDRTNEIMMLLTR